MSGNSSNNQLVLFTKSITPGAEELRAITAMIDLKPLPAVQFCKAHDPDYGHPMKVAKRFAPVIG